jgi:hypothetical protein
MQHAMGKTIIVVLSIAALVGCAHVPKEDVASADRAMDAARAADAADYAPETWAAAEGHRQQLQGELDSQEKKFAFSRSYDKARTLAIETTELADRATAEAATGKERARQEAGDAIAQARQLKEEVEQLLEKAPRGKGTKAELATLKSDAGSTEASLGEAQAAYDAGSYLEARTKAEDALRKLGGIKAEIERARQVRGSRA